MYRPCIYLCHLIVLLCSFSMTVLPAPAPSNPLQFCPIHPESNALYTNFISENDTRVIDLSKIERKKVKISFYSPNHARALEAETTTLFAPKELDSTQHIDLGAVSTLSAISSTSDTATGTTPTELSRTNTPLGGNEIYNEDTSTDILCNWEFRAANESEYLLLTFDNLSAPYSIDCSDAYVAVQKDNGYESRWCGNRRQANARPMALFSKTSAKITVFRKSNAPSFPQTGFSVAVESLAVETVAANGAENSLRVLLG